MKDEEVEIEIQRRLKAAVEEKEAQLVALHQEIKFVIIFSLCTMCDVVVSV